MSAYEDNSGLDIGAIESAVEQQRVNTAHAGSRRLIIAEGETTRLRIIPGPGQPHRWDRHWYNGKKRYITCALGVAGHVGCSCCHYRSSDKAIGNNQPCLSFSMISDRHMHVTETGEGDNVQRKYFECKNQTWNDTEVHCDLCVSGNERKREGKRFWDIAPKHASVINAENKKLQRRCASCKGVGMLKVVEFACPSCEEPGLSVPEGADKIVCAECNSMVRPVPIRECSSGCEDPKPRSITDCWFLVVRTGGGTNTAYSIDPEPMSTLDDEDSKEEPYDFVTLKAPKDQGEIAVGMLGKSNPYGPDGSGGNSGVGGDTIWND